MENFTYYVIQVIKKTPRIAENTGSEYPIKMPRNKGLLKSKESWPLGPGFNITPKGVLLTVR